MKNIKIFYCYTYQNKDTVYTDASYYIQTCIYTYTQMYGACTGINTCVHYVYIHITRYTKKKKETSKHDSYLLHDCPNLYQSSNS